MDIDSVFLFWHSAEHMRTGRERKEIKRGGEDRGCGERGLSKGEVCAVDGANAQYSQGWKRPWGLWGVGLRLKEQKRSRHAPHPWSQRAGDLTWEPSSLPGLKWVGQIPSAPLLLLPSWRAPPTCLSCSLPASLLHPQDQPGLEGTSESVGPGPRAGQTSPADSAGEMLGVLPPDQIGRAHV